MAILLQPDPVSEALKEMADFSELATDVIMELREEVNRLKKKIEDLEKDKKSARKKMTQETLDKIKRANNRLREMKRRQQVLATEEALSRDRSTRAGGISHFPNARFRR